MRIFPPRLFTLLLLGTVVLTGCSRSDSQGDSQNDSAGNGDTGNGGTTVEQSESADGIGDPPEATAERSEGGEPEAVQMERTSPERRLPRSSQDNGSPSGQSAAAGLSPPDEAFRALYQDIQNSRAFAPYDTEMDRVQIDDHPAIPAITAFLEAVSGQTLPADRIAAGEDFMLELELEPLLTGDISITGHRLGRITSEDRKTRVPLRLYSDISSAVGEIFLVEEDGEFVVQDVAFPWEQLAEPRTPPRFEPATHQWTVGSTP